MPATLLPPLDSAAQQIASIFTTVFLEPKSIWQIVPNLSMPLTTTGSSLRHLPLFFAYCPDRANVLPKRLEVRPAHWARWAKDREDGCGGTCFHSFQPDLHAVPSEPYQSLSASAFYDPNTRFRAFEAAS